MTLSLPSAPQRSTGQPCVVAVIRDGLAPEDQAKVDAWLADKNVAAWRVASAIDVGATTIKDHRGLRCGCYRGKKP